MTREIFKRISNVYIGKKIFRSVGTHRVVFKDYKIKPKRKKEKLEKIALVPGMTLTVDDVVMLNKGSNTVYIGKKCTT